MKFRLFPRAFFYLFLPGFFLLQTTQAQTPANKIVFTLSPDGSAASRPRVLTIAENGALEISKSKFDGKAVNVSELERREFDLINQKRAEAGLPALVWNEAVARAARLHSESMATNDFFSHTGLDGKLVNARADAAGVKHWRMIGENIAYNRGYADAARCAAEKWMLSPGHRDNILRADWTETGIGVAVTEKGTFYFTQVFLLKK